MRKGTQGTLSTQRRFSASFASAAFLIVSLSVVACGKKGPPLPPLVKLPVPPADLVAERRGETVDLQFTVPSVNTDGTKPANVAAVDVYAFTGPATLTDEQILKVATKAATVAVKAPKDPNQTVEENEAESDVEPPQGTGLDQGAVARAAEKLPPDAATPIDPAKVAKRGKKPDDDVMLDGPLLPPQPASVPLRTYVAHGLSTRGKKGPFSKRVTVPLVPAPPVPRDLTMKYTERMIDVSWRPPGAEKTADDKDKAKDQEKDAVRPLASRPLGYTPPPIAYNVYQIPDDSDDAAGAAAAAPVKLTKNPLNSPGYSDDRLTWGEYRCYQVRAVQTVAGVAIESDAPEPVCDTLVDTFEPAAPRSLQAVPSEGAISLIWEPNSEKDLAGYLVLRASGEGQLQPMTPAPITATTFRDAVEPGARYAYVVQAVDKAGNVSASSNRVEEIAR